jgi:hypothetical protein
MNSNQNKIAMCLSGQPRTWRKCIDSWYKNVPMDDIDIFCHIWDFNSPGEPPVTGGEIDELMGILKPKKVLVEHRKEFLPFNESQAILFDNVLSQYYGIFQAANLKKEYEIENFIQYKRVLRSRYDLFFNTDIRSDILCSKLPANTMMGIHYGWDPQKHLGRVGDLTWAADSRTHDILADLYFNLCYITSDMLKTLSPEYTFFHYIKKNSINIEIRHWDVKLYRSMFENVRGGKETNYEVW